MKTNLLFDFTVNKENNTIIVKREFDANLALVWQAWTTAELLDQWWGPAPCKAKTKTMDFREGGYWLYCMIIPTTVTGGETEQIHWARQDFEKIILHKNFYGTDVFCDENGITNPEFPSGRFENIFSEVDGKTLVSIISTHNSLEDLQQIIEMGYQEGMEVNLKQLDELLLTLK